MSNNEDKIRKDLEYIKNEFNSHEFESFFKYCNDDENVINGIFKNHKIRFTQPRALNDPMEFNPTLVFKDIDYNYQYYNFNGVILPSIETFFRVQLIESQINKYGILSLTKIPDSFEMWSRYSNGHRGFLLELKKDFTSYNCMKSINGEKYEVKKVEYVDDYSINIENLVNKDKEITIQSLINEIFYKKTSIWKYESEYRVIRLLTDCPNYKLPLTKYSYSDNNIYLFPIDPECINSIVLGAMMSKENKSMIINFCKDNNILVSQAHIIRNYKDRFNLPDMIYLNPLDNLETLDLTLNTDPKLYCTDIYRISRGDVRNVNKLSDLPYYLNYEKVVEELYQNLKINR